MNNIERWAKREIELQLKECKNDWYTENVLKCAYEVYKELCRQNHSGMSIQLVKSVLNRLIDCKPLSPIEGNDDEWNDVTWNDSANEYQNKRYSALFKNVYKDGTVTYNDVDRWQCYDDNGITFNSGAVSRILDKKYPISLPYNPVSEKVYVKEFLVDKNNGDFDTLYFKYKDIEVYMTEKDDELVEIDKEEFDSLVGEVEYAEIH